MPWQSLTFNEVQEPSPPKRLLLFAMALKKIMFLVREKNPNLWMELFENGAAVNRRHQQGGEKSSLPIAKNPSCLIFQSIYQQI